jgi:hypothetical protein
MRTIDSYRGLKRGDCIKVNAHSYPNKKLAKIVDIYKIGKNIRFVVKMGGGVRVDLHKDSVIFKDGPLVCGCAIEVLFSSGCLCGGI